MNKNIDFNSHKHIQDFSDEEFNLIVTFHDYFYIHNDNDRLAEELTFWLVDIFGQRDYNLNIFFDCFEEYKSIILGDPCDYIIEFCNLFMEVIFNEKFK